MNKLLVLPLIALVFGLQSCSTDDGDIFVESPVLGFWSITSYTITAPVDLNNDGVFSTNVLIELPCYNQVFNFMANGEFNSTADSIEVIEATTDQGDIITVGNCDTTQILNGTWELEDNVLTITVSETSYSQVIEVTETTFSITDIGIFGEETLLFTKQ